ncbi:MAG: SpoIID/LytB domain-containing protein [Caldilineaceae bacterium]
MRILIRSIIVLWMLLLTLFTLLFSLYPAQLFAFAPTAPTIQTGDSSAYAYLRVNGHILIDQPGQHLDHPQLSPDGKTIAVALIPTGSETAAFAQIDLFDSASGQLLTTLPGHTPQWAADSQTLTFHAQAQIIAYNLDTHEQIVTAANATDETNPPLATRHSPLAPSYPQTIRVLHHANNACRHEPAGQIDTIPFEEYVARVVPAEMPAFWQYDALAAQAVAARTYAWGQILAGRPDYDVTDWANFQMMCDDRYPIPDEAVAQTAGQYLSEIGDAAAWPISAMYSAENGHPTLTNPSVTYLKGVPDLFALGKVRNGHGYGLSQWGAQRRALAGHTYRQILGYYYSNVNLQNATNPGQPLGGFSAPLPGDALTTNALNWRALVPYAATDAQVKLYGVNFAEPVILSGPEGIWRAPVTLNEGTILTAELWVGGARQEQVLLPIDTTPPPSPQLIVPPVVTSPNVSITVNAGEGAVAGLRQAWLWEGETLSHTANSGVLATDAQATNGTTWLARAGVQQAGVWYGPYTTVLPAGYHYRAIFRLRANVDAALTAAAQTVAPLAHLDVTDNGGDEILGLRDVWASDFVNSTAYRALAVDFHLFEPAKGLEFRVSWPGATGLALDYVQIWQLPDADQAGQPLNWDVSERLGVQTFSAAAFDPAGNMSQPTNQTIQVIDNQPPVFGDLQAPTGWISMTNVNVSANVTDVFSGLDAKRAALILDQQSLSATLSAPNTPKAPQTVKAQVQQLTEGQHTAHFRVADRAGNEVQSHSFPLWVDTTRPTITATINLTATTPWFTTPVSVTLAGQDERSGIQQLVYTVDQTTGVYKQPFVLATPGRHQLRYWAIDNAGNASPPQMLTVTLDLMPPTITLTAMLLRPGQVQLQWQSADDASGVAHIDLQTQQLDGAWQDTATSPTQTVGSLVFAVAEDTVLPVRMRATDNAGRTGDWVEKQLAPASSWVYLPLVSR